MISRIIKHEQFKSEILQNSRTLYVYVPPGYDDEQFRESRYPVLYMQDGQHAFYADDAGGSWDIHITADRLIAEGRVRPFIIVGVSHISNVRISEYLHPMEGNESIQDVESKGHEYERFLIEEVKTFVDRNYRTLDGPEHTAVQGASAGGLVSYHLAFNRPDVFGLVGAMCPYFVSVDALTGKETRLGEKYTQKVPIKIWMDVGEYEGYTVMEKHVRAFADGLIDMGFQPGIDFWYYYVPDSGHSQKDWANRVHAPLLAFFGDIGQPERGELFGEECVALHDSVQRVNPVIFYNSGFVETDTDGVYEVEDPSIIRVETDGRLIPLREGATTIVYCKGKIRTQLSLTVVRELPEWVTVDIRVDVPPHTPETDYIYAGIPLPRTGEFEFGGAFQVPRSFACEFRISRSMNIMETAVDGSEVPFRRFKATDGLKLCYCVENWNDTLKETVR
ncbi:enterochelin esterase-like enzyme [Fontibacillus solani]|uniref:Enterochelin esterase-like enzyme n=1 Tax=Fontibacillus solani TaxID=1572857 RepID=A0A7W3SYK7_9BACL|nr:alpha/beta hydrolase-fold protein [Fontibacillus solani]MBA9088540.1 enterochelin esterase-like enzyme [Fontibacillus solani]